ncbi:hypothetical protein [Burkholderia pseudomallei]|uniref:hypothetical protein n=1 Tax=Burkholderia pseudomallei TaxID=28450 RepID=UPI0012B312C8|nr:hypothetical protein [Burkholderia pseudomallei]
MKIGSELKIFLALLCVFLFGSASASEQKSLGLGVDSSRAVFSALDRFRGDGYRQDGYRITINERLDGIEVVFIPPLKKSNNLIGVEQSDLPEIHYYLDSSGKKILKKLLGQ